MESEKLRLKVPQRWQLAWIAQAALIVLPVAVLSVAALRFLREDKAAILEEARSRAQSLASEVARRIGEAASARLSEDLKKGRLQQGEIVNGHAFAVPDYSRVPVPSDWPAELLPAEARLWSDAQDATYRKPDVRAARKALAALVASTAPRVARANAQLGLLQSMGQRADSAMMIHQAVVLAELYPTEVTESGAPVAALALLAALRHVQSGNPPQELVSEIERNTSQHPSFLTPELLDAAAHVATAEPAHGMISKLRDKWSAEEARREAIRQHLQWAAPQRSQNMPAATYSAPGPLELWTRTGNGWRLTQVPANLFQSAINSWRPSLPPYMAAWVDMGTSGWHVGGKAVGERFLPLASVPGKLFVDAEYPYTAVIALSHPDLLYTPFFRRQAVLEWLVFSAAAAAMFGLWRLWRSYQAQTRLNEMKSNLVSSVSHELRAPIAAVRLMAESLENGRVAEDGKRQDYYHLIVRECRRLSALVENVLDFSRIDQGRKQYRFEPLDPLALVRHTVMLMEPCAAERQVRLALADPPPDCRNLQPSWDSQAIEQSLVNLLDNAIKHSPAGAEVRVEMETSNGAVCYWVADHGPGIPAAEQQRIFDLFYRHGSELRRETPGVGIGLSIVKHVAEAHGGRVLVESTVGQGSRFGLELPR